MKAKTKQLIRSMGGPWKKKTRRSKTKAERATITLNKGIND